MTVNVAQFLIPHFATPGKVLYRHHTGDGWRDVTAAEVAREVARWQAAFRREGLVRGERVAVCMRNGLPWVALDLAALGLGLVVVPLYVDDNADNIAWCVAHAQARLLVVESSRIAAGLRGVAGQATPLPPLVVVRPDAGETAPTVAAFLPAGGEAGDVVVEPLPPDTLATICFTSGTAGRPKGVMLSHGNIHANTRQCEATGMARVDDVFLSILPLSHMFERTGGYYLPLAIGATVVFCRGIVHVADDLVQQAPTAMFAVPRIFERFHARIEQALAEAPVRRWLVRQTVACANRVADRRAGAFDRLLLPLLQRGVGARVLARLGGRLRLVVVGGAALDPALARFFIGLGLPMLQGYGMTEASPVLAVNRLHDNVPASVGAPLDGVEVRLGSTGELVIRGSNVMRGYWQNEAATRAALDEGGWLHTGDLAEIRDGKIFIRGRAKDILVMSNGEKLPPVDAELAILRDPVFQQVMLVGEARPFLVLVAVSDETDERTLVARANEQLKEFPRWVRVRRVVATTQGWSVDNGLLTPTLKLKRPLLLQKLAREIDAAYAEN
jgi:long-chain acyl-CoA synthetase